jgi:ribosomal-protein-alanine N-acetyltransferase
MECPQIHQMHSYGFATIDAIQSYIQLLLNEYQCGKVRTLAIAEKSTNKLIGLITLDVVEIFARAEISYWINRSYRNKGYATEAIKGIIKYSFDSLSLNRIQAITSNSASERVLFKAGMIYEGTLRQYFRIGDIYWDVKMYAILKEDFIKYA